MAKKSKPISKGQKPKSGKLPLYPLSIEDALRGAAQTGQAPKKAKARISRSKSRIP
jgi:hypothetical protein